MIGGILSLFVVLGLAAFAGGVSFASVAPITRTQTQTMTSVSVSTEIVPGTVTLIRSTSTITQTLQNYSTETITTTAIASERTANQSFFFIAQAGITGVYYVPSLNLTAISFSPAIPFNGCGSRNESLAIDNGDHFNTTRIGEQAAISVLENVTYVTYFQQNTLVSSYTNCNLILTWSIL